MNGTPSYLLRDQLQSVRAMFNDQGQRTKHTIYKPFGEFHEWVDTPGLTMEAETNGFIGERYDAGAGLQYLNARYYDPALAIAATFGKAASRVGVKGIDALAIRKQVGRLPPVPSAWSRQTVPLKARRWYRLRMG